MKATNYRDRRGRAIFLENEVCIVDGDLKGKIGVVINVTSKGDVSIGMEGRNKPVLVYCKDVVVVIPDLDIDHFLDEDVELVDDSDIEE